jgi:hypothetical protein
VRVGASFFGRSKEQGARSKEQGARSKEQVTRSEERGARSEEQSAGVGYGARFGNRRALEVEATMIESDVIFGSLAILF